MAFKHYEQIKFQELPPMDTGNVKVFSQSFVVSEDDDKPITSGLFGLEAGESLEYNYTYHEMELIVDGSFIIEDETGIRDTAKPGDLFYLLKGSAIKFLTPDFGISFLFGQRGEDEA
jgi:ethanolamine utilization protein EutQ (cupin superfamily)